MRFRGWWIFVVVGAVTLLVLTSLYFGQGLSADDPRRTTYSHSRAGTMALYETVYDIGIKVKRHLKPLTAPPDPGVLFIVSPLLGKGGYGSQISIEGDEWSALEKWVSAGNTLIWCGAFPISMLFPEEAKPEISLPVVPSVLSAGVRDLCAMSKNDARSPLENEKSEEPLPVSLSKGRLPEFANNVDEYISLFRNGRETTVGCCRVGKGMVIAFSDDWPFTNAGISDGDNAIVLLNAAMHFTNGGKLTVTFDEFHNGYSDAKGQGIISLIGPYTKLALGQLALAFVLAVIVMSRRFGSVIVLREKARFRSEYISSMSDLLQRGGATDIVNEELGRLFLDRILHMLRLPKTADSSAIVVAAEARGLKNTNELSELVAAAQEIGNGRMEAEMLSLAHRWHKMRNEIGGLV